MFTRIKLHKQDKNKFSNTFNISKKYKKTAVSGFFILSFFSFSTNVFATAPSPQSAETFKIKTSEMCVSSLKNSSIVEILGMNASEQVKYCGCVADGLSSSVTEEELQAANSAHELPDSLQNKAQNLASTCLTKEQP